MRLRATAGGGISSAETANAGLGGRGGSRESLSQVSPEERRWIPRRINRGEGKRVVKWKRELEDLKILEIKQDNSPEDRGAC